MDGQTEGRTIKCEKNRKEEIIFIITVLHNFFSDDFYNHYKINIFMTLCTKAK